MTDHASKRDRFCHGLDGDDGARSRVPRELPLLERARIPQASLGQKDRHDLAQVQTMASGTCNVRVLKSSDLEEMLPTMQVSRSSVHFEPMLISLEWGG